MVFWRKKKKEKKETHLASGLCCVQNEISNEQVLSIFREGGGKREIRWNLDISVLATMSLHQKKSDEIYSLRRLRI